MKTAKFWISIIAYHFGQRTFLEKINHCDWGPPVYTTLSLHRHLTTSDFAPRNGLDARKDHGVLEDILIESSEKVGQTQLDSCYCTTVCDFIVIGIPFNHGRITGASLENMLGMIRPRVWRIEQEIL